MGRENRRARNIPASAENSAAAPAVTSTERRMVPSDA